MESASALDFPTQDLLDVRITDRESASNAFYSIDGRELLNVYAITNNPETSSVTLTGAGYNAWFTALIEIRQYSIPHRSDGLE